MNTVLPRIEHLQPPHLQQRQVIHPPCRRCRRLRSAAKRSQTRQPHSPDPPQRLILRLLRSRSQPACLVSSYRKSAVNPAFVVAAEGCDRARSVRKPDDSIHLPPPQCLTLRLLRSRSQPAFLVSSYRRLVVIPAFVGAAAGCDRARSVRKPDNLIHLTHHSA